MSGASPAELDLKAARAKVLATIAGSPMSREPPNARAVAPLRPLSPELEAKLAARDDPGRLPSGVATERARSLRRVVVPCAVLAVIDATGVVIGLVSGHYLLAVVAGLLFVPLAALAVIGGGLLRHDQGRLTPAEGRAVAAASRWDTNQQWTGPLAYCTERGVVIAAAREAERIARNPRWRAGTFGEPRIRLNLAAELDQIDNQAHRIAVARHGQGAGPATDTAVVESAWDATVNRVAALVAYADNLDGLTARSAAAIPGGGDPVRNADLLTGSVRDEFAVEQLVALTLYLDGDRGDPFG